MPASECSGCPKMEDFPETARTNPSPFIVPAPKNADDEPRPFRPRCLAKSKQMSIMPDQHNGPRL